MVTHGKLQRHAYPDALGAFPSAGHRDDPGIGDTRQSRADHRRPYAPNRAFRNVTPGDMHNSTKHQDQDDAAQARGSDAVHPEAGAQVMEHDEAHNILLRAIPKDRLEALLKPYPDVDASDPLRSLFGSDTHTDMVAGLIHRIQAEAEAESASSGLKVEGLFMTLLGVLLEEGDAPEPAEPSDVAALDQRRLDRVLEYMDTNLQSRIRIEDLANVACLSPFHFSRAFRAALGMPPHKFLTKRRIEAATELLRNSDASLSEIAMMTGFSSQAHFTRQFTRALGVAPGKFRRDLTS
ncbi:MAG: AraC family transcriptional regulator [Pseudomonadota bacterium]